MYIRKLDKYSNPNSEGFYGEYGGMYVPNDFKNVLKKLSIFTLPIVVKTVKEKQSDRLFFTTHLKSRQNTGI